MSTTTQTPELSTPSGSIPPDQLDKIKAQVQEELEPKLRAQLEEQNNIDIAKFKDEYRKINEESFKKFVLEWEEEERKKRKPLTPDELQKLLSKEYTKFSLEIEDSQGKIIPFTLRELPQSIEREFYKIAKETLSLLTTEYSGLDLKTADGDVLEKMLGLMNMFDPVQDVFVKCVVLCLNPKKKIDYLTEDWVKDNLTNYRMITILLAQAEVNKMRDFFSILFQGFQNAITKNAAGSLL